MRSGSAGFTFIELIITVTVAGVLIAIGVPAFTQTIYSNRLTTTSNEIVASMTGARLEAIRRNAVVPIVPNSRISVQFCSNVAATNGSGNNLASSCGTSLGAVWLLETDNTPTKVKDAVQLPSAISAASVQALLYSGSGQATAVGGSGPYSGLVADIATTKLNTNNHRCIYMTTGSIVSSCSNTGTCPNSEPTSCQ